MGVGRGRDFFAVKDKMDDRLILVFDRIGNRIPPCGLVPFVIGK